MKWAGAWSQRSLGSGMVVRPNTSCTRPQSRSKNNAENHTACMDECRMRRGCMGRVGATAYYNYSAYRGRMDGVGGKVGGVIIASWAVWAGMTKSKQIN